MHAHARVPPGARLRVMGVPTQLERVAENLIDNAVTLCLDTLLSVDLRTRLLGSVLTGGGFEGEHTRTGELVQVESSSPICGARFANGYQIGQLADRIDLIQGAPN